MAVSIEEVLERTMEQAFRKAMEKTVRAKAEELFRKALSPGSPVAQKLQEKMEQGFQHFLEDGIRWEKKSPASRNNYSVPKKP